MTRDEARSLTKGDQITWRWQDATDDNTTPGTVVATDSDGLEIFWADCIHYPTRYEFDEDGPWPHIEKHTPNLVYIPDPDHDAPVPRRRKKKK